MTVQAAIPVVGCFVARVWELVGVVAREATHLARARSEATALMHLFDLAEESGLVEILRLHEHRFDRRQGQPRAVVGEAPARPDDADIALQVALLADRLTEHGWQPGRVHDVR